MAPPVAQWVAWTCSRAVVAGLPPATTIHQQLLSQKLCTTLAQSSADLPQVLNALLTATA